MWIKYIFPVRIIVNRLTFWDLSWQLKPTKASFRPRKVPQRNVIPGTFLVQSWYVSHRFASNPLLVQKFAAFANGRLKSLRRVSTLCVLLDIYWHLLVESSLVWKLNFLHHLALDLGASCFHRKSVSGKSSWRARACNVASRSATMRNVCVCILL